MENKAYSAAKAAIAVFCQDNNLDALHETLSNITLPDYAHHERYALWLAKHMDTLRDMHQGNNVGAAGYGQTQLDTLLAGFAC